MHESPPPPSPSQDHPGRRRLTHGVAWLLATGAAVTLSWWGVHTVMSGTVYDPPQALPVAATQDEPDAKPPVSSSTHRPEPSTSTRKPSASPSRTSPSPSRSASSPSPTPRTTSPAPPSSGSVKSYATTGGRAVFDLQKTSATLVSATPAAGWSVEVWKQATWIRVEFTSGEKKVSVFCTWHDHEPTVEIAKY
ncbi:hypothetical protein OG785_22785 [Streptomyces sp. NBC_00006]|uniref:hypothetical protein n=1 Tax=unclassified Streptomyces TaxID=2593676 RepID=UPI00224EBD3A|nr:MULTISPECIES: hypothetical protein [unclassified Streptomyces]MCX5533366.1 hypothetical protein [Streptomyces sp. NBC_00006]